MENIKYEGKMFAIVEKKVVINGKECVFEIGRRAPGVRLIIDNGDGTLLLTKEYRPELSRYDIRLPGGKVCDTLKDYLELTAKETNLEPAIEAAARKEAVEETGITGGDFKKFHTSVAGLTVDWSLHYFVVSGHTHGEQQLEEHEDIETVAVSKDEARLMCLDGRISEERSALVLLRYLNS
jgi:8-oxo-dGTP pyrophosphatase MutT (NUDIX family)